MLQDECVSEFEFLLPNFTNFCEIGVDCFLGRSCQLHRLCKDPSLSDRAAPLLLTLAHHPSTAVLLVVHDSLPVEHKEN